MLKLRTKARTTRRRRRRRRRRVFGAKAGSR